MSRAFLTVPESWTFELTETIEQMIPRRSLSHVYKQVVGFSIHYCKLMNNFMVNLDNNRFNNSVNEINIEIELASLDVAMVNYYQKKLYLELRHSFQSINSLIEIIEPLFDNNGELNAMVVYYV